MILYSFGNNTIFKWSKIISSWKYTISNKKHTMFWYARVLSKPTNTKIFIYSVYYNINRCISSNIKCESLEFFLGEEIFSYFLSFALIWISMLFYLRWRIFIANKHGNHSFSVFPYSSWYMSRYPSIFVCLRNQLSNFFSFVYVYFESIYFFPIIFCVCIEFCSTRRRQKKVLQTRRNQVITNLFLYLREIPSCQYPNFIFLEEKRKNLSHFWSHYTSGWSKCFIHVKDNHIYHTIHQQLLLQPWGLCLIKDIIFQILQ